MTRTSSPPSAFTSPTRRFRAGAVMLSTLLAALGNVARVRAAPPPTEPAPAAPAAAGSSTPQPPPTAAQATLASEEGSLGRVDEGTLGPVGRLQATLEEARRAVKDDPTDLTPLREAIAQVEDHPASLRSDPALREARSLARLELVRAALATADQAAGTALADDALRLEPEAARFAERLGPSVAAFVSARASEVDASARLDVTCTTPCRVFVDEHPRDIGSIALVPGVHRLHVDGPGAVELALALELAPGERHATSWPIAVAERPVAAELPPPAPARLLPRAVEGMLIGVGTALTATGAALIGIDGRCPGGGSSSEVTACPNVYATRPAGGATLALGVTGAITGLVPLIIDEARMARHRRAQRRAEASPKTLPGR